MLRLVLPPPPPATSLEWREKSLFWKDEGTEHKDGFKVIICLFGYLLSSTEGAASNLFEHFLMLLIMGQKYSSIKPQNHSTEQARLLSLYCMDQETLCRLGGYNDSQKGHRESPSLCRTRTCVVSRQRSALVFLNVPHDRQQNTEDAGLHYTRHTNGWRQSFHFKLEYKTTAMQEETLLIACHLTDKNHIFSDFLAGTS